MFKNKKIILLIIFFLTFFYTSSYSEVVKNVEVKGNERISLETIVIYGDISIGQDYSSSDINLLIKKLYETNFFSNIAVDLSNNKLTIEVKENSIVSSIVFDGEKSKKKKAKILELLSLRENGSFIQNYIKNDVEIIKTLYKGAGYYFVQVEVDIEKLKNNRINIIYLLDKGKRAKISKINFLGDKKIREKRLRDIITSQESRFWKFLSQSHYLNKERVELDKRLIKSYYRNKGYYEVNVKTTNVEYSKDEGFILTFNIDAGKRYKFSKIFADVAKSLDQTAFLSLETEFNKIIGDYYSNKKVKNILNKIDSLSEQKELQFINHNIVETLVSDGVEVKINIFEGEKVLIERINIVGNSITNDDVIRGELIVDEGDPFSTLLVNKSMNNLRGRRIFSKVGYEVLPGSSEDLKVIKVSVEEQATGEIMAGAGIGTDGKNFQFAVSENNWLGRGVKVKTFLSLTESKVKGSLEVANPNYKFSGNEVVTAVSVSSTDRAETSGFKSKKTGFELGTIFEQYENIFISPTILVAFEDIVTDSGASAGIKKMDGSYFNTDIEYGISLDKRNQAFRPTKGYKTRFIQSVPLVQDKSSFTNGIDVASYHEFSEDVIGSLKFFAKAVVGIDDDVRLTERLYLPRNKLRGFNKNKTGPKDGNDYIGGNYTTSINAEAQLPNLLPEAYKTDFSLFFDTANIWGVDYEGNASETNELRSSVGISANVFTAIGPLSFTLAQDLAKAETDETETFNFRLGTSF